MRARPIVAGLTGNDQARRVLGRLHAAGVRRDAISLLMAEVDHSPSFALHTGTKLSEGVALGAGLGGALGAIIGALIVVGGVLGARVTELGPSLVALIGAGIGGGIGTIVGALVGLGAPEYRAKLVQGSARGEKILIAVWVEGEVEAEQVSRILGGLL